MEGRGIEEWTDGRRYEGDFKNGKKDGEGVFEWPNGVRYIGSWRNGKQHGSRAWIWVKWPAHKGSIYELIIKKAFVII